MAPRTSLLAIAATTLLLSACGEEKVSTYRVPKEKEAEAPLAAAPEAGGSSVPAAGASMADTAVPTATGEALVWTAPAAWAAKAASAMRKGSYSVPGDGGESDLSITAFPGDVGGELANVNRWRGQVGLAPLAAADLEASVNRLEANGLKITLVELASRGDPNNEAILGAIIPFGGSTWFFKLKGPGNAVRSAKPAFLGFLHTVHAP